MWQYESADMTYDDKTHTYTLGGRNLTSVTTLLQESGIINNKFYTEEGAANGSRRHKLTELYDQQNLNWGTIGEADLAYLEGWMKFREERKVEIQGIEIGAYHPLLGYAGRTDRLALIDGEPYIIDIKSGAFSKASELQMILYGMMFTYNGQRPNLMLVHLNNKGTYKPNIVTFKDEKFDMSAIRINQWKV